MAGEPATYTGIFSHLTDLELERAIESAWREASRAWADARRVSDPDVKRMLLDSAVSAEGYWASLVREQDRREGRTRCAVCGEAANTVPYSMAGTAHKYGPRADHSFRPA